MTRLIVAAKMFQAALMGKTLALSVRTNKTLRVHEGIAGTFTFQEQMCALENLRIWQDHESNGVLVMIHFTPQFRDGYLAFYRKATLGTMPDLRRYFHFAVVWDGLTEHFFPLLSEQSTRNETRFESATMALEWSKSKALISRSIAKKERK